MSTLAGKNLEDRRSLSFSSDYLLFGLLPGWITCPSGWLILVDQYINGEEYLP